MIKLFFQLFLKLIKSIVNILLLPVNALITNLFPSFSTMISSFNNAVTTVIGGGLGWFSHLLPPVCKSMIVLYLGILIAYYSIAFSVHLILKVIHIIKEVKIW